MACFLLFLCSFFVLLSEKGVRGSRFSKRPLFPNVIITVLIDIHTCSNEIWFMELTHWGRVTHICVSKLTIIGSDNGLSPDRRKAVIWTNAGLLLIGPWGTNFNEIFIEILTFSCKKMHLKVFSAKQRPFCLGLKVLNDMQSLTYQSMKLYLKFDVSPYIADQLFAISWDTGNLTVESFELSLYFVFINHQQMLIN